MPRPRLPIDWTAVDWSQTDRAIAQQHGCSEESATRWRHRMRSPTVVQLRVRERLMLVVGAVAELRSEDPHRRVTEVMIAERTGLSRSNVQEHLWRAQRARLLEDRAITGRPDLWPTARGATEVVWAAT